MTAIADVVVVGGGTAGCVVAARLVEAGRSVVLIEAGPDYGPRGLGAWPVDLLDAAALPTSHDWGYSGHGAGGQRIEYSRARVLGGCSSHNGCTQTVGWAGDYDAWAPAGAGWSAAELAPLFAEAEAKLRLQRYSPDEVQPFHAAFLAACGASGLAIVDDLGDLNGAAGAGCAAVNALPAPDGSRIRFNSAFAYLDPVRESPLLSVLAGALVDRVILSAGRARGVEVIGAHGRERVGAGEVVLCAGAYGTPEILLRSGVGPAHQLRRLDIDVVADVPGVGENLHDHPTVELTFAGADRLARELELFAQTRWLPEEQSLAKLASPGADGPYDLHMYPWVEPDQSVSSGWRVVVPISQLRPRSRGSIRLRSADPEVRGIVDPRFLSDPEQHDLDSLVFGASAAEEILRRGELVDFIGDPLERRPRSGDDAFRSWTRRNHLHYWHPAGSCRMGAERDPGGVVDFRGRLRGVNGLTIADASIFPDIPRATPALPTVVAAERIARVLCDSTASA